MNQKNRSCSCSLGYLGDIQNSQESQQMEIHDPSLDNFFFWNLREVHHRSLVAPRVTPFKANPSGNKSDHSPERSGELSYWVFDPAIFVCSSDFWFLCKYQMFVS